MSALVALRQPAERVRIAIAALAVFHLVGVVGFGADLSGFALLTPMHLIVVFGAWLSCEPRLTRRLGAALVLVGVGGYGIEVAGVHTGLVFGSYEYGPALGPKVLDVPLMIGVNWALLIAVTAGLAARAARSAWLRALVGAGLMVALDVLLEPFAMTHGFWSWEGDVVPLQNYLAWGAASFVFQLVHTRVAGSSESAPLEANRLSPWVFGFQAGFFGLLGWLT